MPVRIFMYHFLGTCNCLCSFFVVVVFMKRIEKKGTHICFCSSFKSKENSSGIFVVCFRQSLTHFYTKPSKNTNAWFARHTISAKRQQPARHSLTHTLFISASLSRCVTIFSFLLLFFWCAYHSERNRWKCRQTSRHVCLCTHSARTNEISILWLLFYGFVIGAAFAQTNDTMMLCNWFFSKLLMVKIRF